MRNWGVVVTAFYVFILLILFGVGIEFLTEDWWAHDWKSHTGTYDRVYAALIPTAFLVCGQVLLLFLSVDTSWRRLNP